MAAKHLNRLKEFNEALEHTAGAKEAIQGFEAEQCIRIMTKYEEYTSILHDHPQWEDMLVVFRCVKRISEISRRTFEPGSGLITEFANVITELREVVSRQFAIPRTKNSPSDLVHFKNGFYQHNCYEHLVSWMSENGDIIRFSSWVVEAANKYWKWLVLSRITMGGDKDVGDFAYDPSRQALQAFLNMVHPDIAKHSVIFQRDNDIYTCGFCGEDKLPQHSTYCTRQEMRLERKSAAKAQRDRQKFGQLTDLDLELEQDILEIELEGLLDL